MTVGLIGYGRFGRFAARLLVQRCSVVVYDKKRSSVRILSRKIKRVPLAEVAAQPVVILAVPISQLWDTLRSIAPLLRRGALVMDVCAVKVKPVEWMKRLLPKHVSILGTHPLFGPDRARKSVRGLRVVLCPVHMSRGRLSQIRVLAKRSGLLVDVMTPWEHDKRAAETVFLTQYIGRLVGRVSLRRSRNGTASYERLMDLVRVAMGDSPGVFVDMFRYNPYARRVARSLRAGVSDLAQFLEKK